METYKAPPRRITHREATVITEISPTRTAPLPSKTLPHTYESLEAPRVNSGLLQNHSSPIPSAVPSPRTPGGMLQATPSPLRRTGLSPGGGLSLISSSDMSPSPSSQRFDMKRMLSKPATSSPSIASSSNTAQKTSRAARLMRPSTAPSPPTSPGLQFRADERRKSSSAQVASRSSAHGLHAMSKEDTSFPGFLLKPISQYYSSIVKDSDSEEDRNWEPRDPPQVENYKPSYPIPADQFEVFSRGNYLSRGIQHVAMTTEGHVADDHTPNEFPVSEFITPEIHTALHKAREHPRPTIPPAAFRSLEPSPITPPSNPVSPARSTMQDFALSPLSHSSPFDSFSHGSSASEIAQAYRAAQQHHFQTLPRIRQTSRPPLFTGVPTISTPSVSTSSSSNSSPAMSRTASAQHSWTVNASHSTHEYLRGLQNSTGSRMRDSEPYPPVGPSSSPHGRPYEPNTIPHGGHSWEQADSHIDNSQAAQPVTNVFSASTSKPRSRERRRESPSASFTEGGTGAPSDQNYHQKPSQAAAREAPAEWDAPHSSSSSFPMQQQPSSSSNTFENNALEPETPTRPPITHRLSRKLSKRPRKLDFNSSPPNNNHVRSKAKETSNDSVVGDDKTRGMLRPAYSVKVSSHGTPDTGWTSGTGSAFKLYDSPMSSATWASQNSPALSDTNGDEPSSRSSSRLFRLMRKLSTASIKDLRSSTSNSPSSPHQGGPNANVPPVPAIPSSASYASTSTPIHRSRPGHVRKSSSATDFGVLIGSFPDSVTPSGEPPVPETPSGSSGYFSRVFRRRTGSISSRSQVTATTTSSTRSGWSRPSTSSSRQGGDDHTLPANSAWAPIPPIPLEGRAQKQQHHQQPFASGSSVGMNASISLETPTEREPDVFSSAAMGGRGALSDIGHQSSQPATPLRQRSTLRRRIDSLGLLSPQQPPQSPRAVQATETLGSLSPRKKERRPSTTRSAGGSESRGRSASGSAKHEVRRGSSLDGRRVLGDDNGPGAVASFGDSPAPKKSAQEKDIMWDELMRKSARAPGGTLHANVVGAMTTLASDDLEGNIL